VLTALTQSRAKDGDIGTPVSLPLLLGSSSMHVSQYPTAEQMKRCLRFGSAT
jgi:hypothetical protein